MTSGTQSVPFTLSGNVVSVAESAYVFNKAITVKYRVPSIDLREVRLGENVLTPGFAEFFQRKTTSCPFLIFQTKLLEALSYRWRTGACVHLKPRSF